jgi:polysaccharide biosynthesis transport protein
MNEQRARLTRALLAGEEGSFVPDTVRLADRGEGSGLRDLLAILQRRWPLIARITIGGALVVGALALMVPPRYTAKAQLVIQESRAARNDERSSSREQGPDQATIQTQVTALTAHDLLASVIAQLAVDPAFRDIQRRGQGSMPSLTTAGSSSVAIEELERHLRVFQEAGSHVISIAYTSRNPAEAAVVANKITDYYLTAGEEKSGQAPGQAVGALTQKITDLRAESEALEAKVAAYQAAHGVNDASKTNVIDQKLGDLNHQLSATQSELAARRTRHAELQAARGPNGDWEPLLAGLDAQGLVELHSQVLSLLAGRLDSISVLPHAGGAGDAGDAGLESQGDSATLRERVRKELNQALLKLARDASVASAQASAIEQRLGAVQRASDDVQLRDLLAAAAAAHHRYDRLVQRRDELLEQGDDVTASARLLSRASVPHRPSSLSPVLLLAPAVIALLVLASVVALLADRLDQGIYSKRDIVMSLGLRFAGFVPLSRGIIPTEGTAMGSGVEAAAFTEAMRGIMVSLQLSAPHRRRPQIILVTSTVAGEGKTTLALGLAACATRMGAKALLVDLSASAANTLPPPRVAPRDQSGGDMVDPLAPNHSQIEVIPAGPGIRLDYLPVRRRPTEELSPQFTGELLSKTLRRQWSGYDMVFIDSAAVLAKAEVRLLAAIADQIVFAVRWRKTRRDDARAALAMLYTGAQNGAESGATISAAITQVDLDSQGSGPMAGVVSRIRRAFGGPTAQMS